MNQVDLHTHTSASDGAFTPTQLVQRACRLGLKVLAITDHDTVSGVVEGQRAGAACGLEVIAGVEINTDVPKAELHVLGYFVDPNHAELNEQLTRIREGRVNRAKSMAERLGEAGAPVRFERILEIAGEGSVGRPHVAQALLEAGHVTSYSEAFQKYIGRDSPCYVERMKFSPAEACALIRRAGGLPVLAHPIARTDKYGKMIIPVMEADLLSGMLDEGLMGLEVYYNGYDAIEIEYLLGLTRKYDLLVTGGTDFHNVRLNEPDLGGVYVSMKHVRKLKERAAALGAI